MTASQPVNSFTGILVIVRSHVGSSRRANNTVASKQQQCARLYDYTTPTALTAACASAATPVDLVPVKMDAMNRIWQNNYTEVRSLLRLSIPVSTGLLLNRMIPFISVIFVGHLGPAELAAASLGSSLLNIVGLAVMAGLAGAIITLSGQVICSASACLCSLDMSAYAAVLNLFVVCIKPMACLQDHIAACNALAMSHSMISYAHTHLYWAEWSAFSPCCACKSGD